MDLNDPTLALTLLSVDYSNFFVNGFTQGTLNFDAVTMFQEFDFPDCTADRNTSFTIDPIAQIRLDAIHGYLANTLITPMFQVYTFGNNGMWSGVDSGSATWHNDFTDTDSFTSNILIYLEDGEPYGNSVEFKNQVEEWKVIPKPNEFVWINQNHNFMHRATHIAGPRRLLSFEFYIPALI